MTSTASEQSLTDPAKAQSQPEGETSQQLALTLFAELSGVGAEVSNVADKVGFKRNNVFVEIQDLSVTARRAVDVMYFIAAEDPEIRNGYEVDLNYFKWLMAYGSNNRAHLRKVLREAQAGAIQLDKIDDETAPDEHFVSVPLLGIFGFHNGKVRFSLHEPIQRAIKNPESYHFLSLRYVFKNLYAKILYDKLLPHLAVGVTPWISIETLRKWFCLDPDSYTEFKRLKERTIKPSVQQINDVTGWNLTFVTRNVPGSKKVSEISFHIRQRPSARELKAPMILLDEFYHVLRDEFGLSGAQLDEITTHRNKGEYTDDRLSRAIEYTRFQIKQGKVKLPAAYLMKAIKSEYTLGQAMIDIANQKAALEDGRAEAADKQSAEVERNRKNEDSRRKNAATHGYQAFMQMAPAEQETLLEAFVASSAAKVMAMHLKIDQDDIRDLYLTNEEIQGHLGVFVAQKARQQARLKAGQAQQPSLA